MAVATLMGIGECMLELRDQGMGRMQLGYGGDVLNTLVYASRAGLQCRFATVTGDDHYGQWLKEQWLTEGIECELVWHRSNSSPALYVIRNDETGERVFSYWRSASPFAALLAPEAYVAKLASAMRNTTCVYFSGIALAMLDTSSKNRLLEMVSVARESGVVIAFDPNYRARLWEGRGQALEWFQRAYRVSDWVLPSLADERELRGAPTEPDALAHQIARSGATEVVVKDGEQGARIFRENDRCEISSVAANKVVDTTAAGDSFNGAYLASRLAGSAPEAAGRAAAALAAQVVQHPGAIAPREVGSA